MMKRIEKKGWKREKHFSFFNQLDYPHFNITAMLEVKRLLTYCKDQDISFFKAVLYCAVKAANAVPEFRQRIRKEEIIQHDSVHPSYTSMTQAEVFSFTDVRFDPDPYVFFRRCDEQEATVKNAASLEDDPHRDDYLFVSTIPWIHFTSFVHPVHLSEVDSVPRLTWGKYKQQGLDVMLPFSAQAHHALVDGMHTGQLFERLEAYCTDPEMAFRPHWDRAYS
ncbi:MAG: CatA-like O-acetyltransferase [Bacteroidota bacterium]